MGEKHKEKDVSDDALLETFRNPKRTLESRQAQKGELCSKKTREAPEEPSSSKTLQPPFAGRVSMEEDLFTG